MRSRLNTCILEGPHSFIIHLTNTFNAILATGHIPASFLHGHVIPIPKGHDRDLRDPSNYRGISLLSSFSKLFEKVLINIIAPEISQGLPMHIWHLLYAWYKNCSCSVAWNNTTSASFPIHQGVRQGAILSTLLHSIFVDKLLNLLSNSGFGE